MKREFLQGLKVGDAALSKEVIDSIMAENGKDIEAAKAPFADHETIKAQLAEAQKTLKGIQDSGQTIEAAQAKATEWETKYNQAIAEHRAAMADRDFNDLLAGEIRKRGGRNEQAIRGMLDVAALKESKNQLADIQAALDKNAEENTWAYAATEGSGTEMHIKTGAEHGNGGEGTLSGVEAAFAALNPGLKL